MMIECEKLTKHFGPVVAVDEVSFGVDKGEVVGFLGLNGAGKTTTMRILTTYLPATSGIAKVAGHDVMLESMEVRQNIGYLPESVPLYSEMRVEEYLTMRAKLKKVDPKERRKRIDYCLERCRIREVRRRLIGTLSKGYRQRVGLADAMIHDPVILILDEPTAGLDPLQKRETLSLIKELGKDHTILLSTHILPEVEESCHRVIIIHRGRIRLSETVADISKNATIVLETKGPPAEVRKALEAVKDVETVSSNKLEKDWQRFVIHPTPGKDLRAEIGKVLIAKQWELRKLDLEKPSLQDLFVKVMRDEGPKAEKKTA